jgi:hypothetical protein
MTIDRREMLKILPAAVSGALAGTPPAAVSQISSVKLSMKPASTEPYRPLQQVVLHASGDGWENGTGNGTENGTMVVLDGAGREYLRQKAVSALQFTIGGSLGGHTAMLLDAHGAIAGSLAFAVDSSTQIDDEGGVYRELMEAVLWTMMSWNQHAPVNVIHYNGEVYRVFIGWIFDHTLIMKGMKYFWPDLKDAVDFFADTQREDGMIWENCYPATPEFNYFDWKFNYGNFARRFDGGAWQLRRAPVESHVEQYFIEALYATWKATGDDLWMSGKLDAAIKAVRYATSDPYRWSNKFQLMHRGFTIDTWDYVSDDQQRWGESVFMVYLGKSEFGIFHGDNTNLILQCRNLAEMLTKAGREKEAPAFGELANALEARLNRLAWNGNFFTHWIQENPDYHPEVGVDMSKQVSLSNAYALNRGISHDKCVSILKTYRQIRSEMPSTSPGEFYGIYPPFQYDFTKNVPGLVWEYVNGGVITPVAGELAHGAFEHGYEAYGADILRRVKGIADRYRGYLPATLRGKAIEVPERSFQRLDLKEFANASHGADTSGVPLWSPDPNLADLPKGAQKFQGIPFEVIDPTLSPFRSCVVLSRESPYVQAFSLPVKAKAASVYLLQAASRNTTAGMVTIRYTDGTTYSEYMQGGRNLGSWLFPSDTRYKVQGTRVEDIYRVAWQRSTADEQEVGVYASGLNNPHPEREIAFLDFSAGEAENKWLMLAVTLSSAPVFFAPYDDLSTGIPDGWVASVIYALVEGLAGIKDKGTAFSRTALTPRWESADVQSADVTVKYPASQGYCCYQYRVEKNRINVEFTGSAQEFEAQILLPPNRVVQETRLNGQVIMTTQRKVEESSYLVLPEIQGGVHRLEVHLG